MTFTSAIPLHFVYVCVTREKFITLITHALYVLAFHSSSQNNNILHKQNPWFCEESDLKGSDHEVSLLLLGLTGGLNIQFS